MFKNTKHNLIEVLFSILASCFIII